MTIIEEIVILERIIDLIDRGFPLRLNDVRDMADCLLNERDATRVRPRWAENFRALAKDLAIIQGWFTLIQNTIAKYGILDCNIYNFDETRFLIGMLSHAKVVTTSNCRKRPRMKQPGNCEWVSVI
ncbi:fot5 transposase [Colletotrichum tofieldiae]|uniref:Fot5 transposase n=1 Tax=Colletotrichum tofieldiae TaxID=708197 RepID=A0A166NM04_9PEZI|nr:fot5 transposase [Colletotrichum tofieldiae]